MTRRFDHTRSHVDGPGREDTTHEAGTGHPAGTARASTRTRRQHLLVVGAIGFGMGVADLVPGFSGGTVALLAGVYERLVANVREGARALALLLRLRVRDGMRALGAIEWLFVLPLLAGILTAVVLLAGLLSGLLASRPRQLSGLFLGMVLGATVVAAGDLRHRDPRTVGVGVLVAAAAFAGLGLSGGAVDDPALWAYVAAGAIGVCAMILPGVSGAFLLLLLGMYAHVVAALDSRDLVVIGVLGLGFLLGLAGFSTLLSWLLREHHDVVLAALLGLMVGSTRVLWPWPGTEVGDPALGGPVHGEVLPIALLAMGGFLAVIGVGRLARRATRATRS